MPENFSLHFCFWGAFVAEIAASIAVVVALVALWLASTAHRHTESTFTKYSSCLDRQVREAQVEFAQLADKIQREMKDLERSHSSADSQVREHAEKLNTLLQRVKILEHELKSLSDAIPPPAAETCWERFLGLKPKPVLAPCKTHDHLRSELIFGADHDRCRHDRTKNHRRALARLP